MTLNHFRLKLLRNNFKLRAVVATIAWFHGFADAVQLFNITILSKIIK